MLSNYFKITDIGLYAYYLGITVTRNRRTRIIKLLQEAYFEKIIKYFGIQESVEIRTLIVIFKIPEPIEGFEADIVIIKQYISAIGLLIYAILGIRLDIVFAILYYSRYIIRPTKVYVRVVKRIFKYLRRTIKLNLIYEGY